MSESAHVAVLGAGVCGLYAARVLAGAGAPVTVLEKADVVGGLAAGHERNGNFYDLGVHHLHAFDQEIFEDISGLMGDRLIPVQKSAMIRSGDGYRRYPLEFMDLLLGIPPLTLAHAVTGLGLQLVKNKLNSFEPQNAEDALIQLYGRPLYEYFFRDFTHRYWGIPPAGLSATFVRRKMPRLSAVDVVRRSLGLAGLKEPKGAAVESALAEETLYYSPTGSRETPSALADFVRAHGGKVLLESLVVGVDTDEGRVRAVYYVQDGQEMRLACDWCISTIPVPTLVRAFDPPPPPPVLAAGDGLRFKALALYGFLVSRPRVLDALYVYYRDRFFHRIAEPANSGMQVRPEGHTILLVETTCNVGDERWNGGAETIRRVVRDMESEGLITEDEIVETHVFRTEHAYPVFELGFEEHYETVTRFLDRIEGVWSTGREGGFSYPNMHRAMRMGANAAGEVLALRAIGN